MRPEEFVVGAVCHRVYDDDKDPVDSGFVVFLIVDVQVAKASAVLLDCDHEPTKPDFGFVIHGPFAQRCRRLA